MQIEFLQDQINPIVGGAEALTAAATRRAVMG
jgi:hypothetical protein